MSKCTLKILLDRPDRRYTAGEKVKGAVEVEAQGDCECRRLSLDCEWRTEGKGNTYIGGKEDWDLFSGAWTSGERASYAFEFVAPNHPHTYRGHILSVAWRLRAHAELAHALDQKVEEEFELVPGKASAEEDLGPAGNPSDQIVVTTSEAKKKGGVVFAIAIPTFLGAVAISLWFVEGVLGKGILHDWLAAHRGDYWGRLFILGFGALFFGIIALISGGFIFSTLGYELATKKLGEVAVELDPKAVRPGDTFTCKIRFRPQSSVELKEARVRLYGGEWSHWSAPVNSSSRDRNYTHKQGYTTLASHRPLGPGEAVVLEGKIQVPPDAPYTLRVTDNEVNWSVGVGLELKRWPGWSEDFTLTVRP